MSTSPVPHPRDLRLRLDLPAQLQLGEEEAVSVHVIDLSLRGAFVETDLLPASGSGALLVFELEDGELPLDAVVMRAGSSLRDSVHPELDALVVRAYGIGLRFVSVRKQAKQRLGDLLAAVRSGR